MGAAIRMPISCSSSRRFIPILSNIHTDSLSRVFLNTLFGERVVCTLNSVFSHIRTFR